ncbi:hypothetical protein [Streptomyces malaysiensis]|nr:hypothetical protein [Streptomyces sp. M56]
MDPEGTTQCFFVATSTPEHPRPATACPVRHRIGAPGAAVRE